MSFNADAYLKALRLPSITLGGRTYTGRHLSLDEFLPFAERVAKLGAGKLSWEETKHLVRDYCRAAFPQPWWQKPVAEKLLRTPPAVIKKALSDFFACQARAMAVPGADDAMALQPQTR